MLPIGWALIIAAVLTLSHLFLRNVALHNVFYLLGAAGVAIDFAGWLSPELLLVGLAIMTIYDLLAGPPGGAIEELAGKLVRQGIVPGLVIADRFRDLWVTIDTAMKRNSALLGAGDVILPLALVARAAFAGSWQPLVVLAGILVSSLLLARGEMTHPRAMLPALALGAAAPFIVLRLFACV
jgi:presenilin-like A22 family membrane protease